MAFVGWLLLGACCGWIVPRLGRRITGNRPLDMLVGMVGAFWAGLAACQGLGCDVGGLGVSTMPAALIGALLALGVYCRLLRRR